MPILAIDTATLVSSVALAAADTLVAELTLQTKKTHSELLMPHIDRILQMATIEKSLLKAVAVSIGPGSFTGLRIGLATAKALAYALHIPLIGVPSLAALAFNCPVPGSILSPVLDAQKGNVYQALYTWQNAELTELVPPRVISFAAALEELAVREHPVLLLGEAAVAHRREIEARGANIMMAAPHVVMARAGSIAMLAHRLLKQGVYHDVFSLEPLYIRRSEAEELWEKRCGAVQ
ncbi:hypothetical protein P22_2381 [Propionispora sp. 2/2-37]|uniref:tRNA (adenosine(37)-N6)-threonylcarbamoyltransferase complex dimerization subunit type 1 TsaB n=1 Tax=Propionispora sp. 2/2-37 TaxID=1677858 RepID=UPI0006BB9547|nr:tRNA (adenosine(37)-N6)-threonylcarbamoyltransferase complex dimerization subunit type 1 TsaB [Propionispora sp. 2/2-37]CUH96291.1 hypothetical protein P22_2381 [Propionispora sp. 2/2-37]